MEFDVHVPHDQMTAAVDAPHKDKVSADMRKARPALPRSWAYWARIFQAPSRPKESEDPSSKRKGF